MPKIFEICLFIGKGCAHAKAHVWQSKDILLALVLFFHHVDTRDRIQIVRLGSKHLSPWARPLAPMILEIFIVFGLNHVSVPWKWGTLAFSLLKPSVCIHCPLLFLVVYLLFQHWGLNIGCVLNKCSAIKPHSQPFTGGFRAHTPLLTSISSLFSACFFCVCVCVVYMHM